MTTPKGKPKPNIRAIAKLVQLSPTTVSLALRGAARIPSDTRARVMAAAEELNYVYSPRTPSEDVATRRIAFVMSDYGHQPVIANPFFAQVLQGVEAACNQYGAALTFSVLMHSHSPSAPLPATLRYAAVDGVVLAGEYTVEMINRVQRELGKLIVLVDNLIPGLPYDSVNADDFGGGYLATQYLLDLGHRRITAISGHPGVPSLRERYRGFQAACAAAGVEPEPPISTSPTWDPLAIRAELEAHLRTLPLPHALFCTVDDYAIAAIEACRAHGIAVPEKVSIVGFDDLDTTRLRYPMLTTVHNAPHALGQIAVERLLSRVAGEERPFQHIALGVELVIRQTTTRPAVG